MSAQKTVITILTEIQVNILTQIYFIHVHSDWGLCFYRKHTSVLRIRRIQKTVPFFHSEEGAI